LISALDKASFYKPDDKQILENIIIITQTYMKKHTNDITGESVRLTDSAYMDAKNKIQEVTNKIQKLDASYSAEIPSGGGPCFIATATYGSLMAPEVILFRQFRNVYLEPRPFGKVLVKAYYKISPPVARVISRSKILKWIIRQILKPIIIILKMDHKRLCKLNS
ncbi:MAG: CFI-box-CTERM domain-containing protein, partial [Deltaproteobacteria bacterium]